MRALIQRVTRAEVRVDERTVGQIDRGLLVLVGFTHTDGPEQLEWMADKVCGLRIFSDADDKMNLSVADVHGSMLVVSQFTLYGDIRKGRRPAFDAAAPPEHARALYESVVRELRAAQLPVATGEFQATMRVELVNDGPVTVLIDSKRQF